MMQKTRHIVIALLMLTSISLKSVDDITGDVGTAQTGSIIISGGSSGAVFNSTTNTITESFNFLQLPATTTSTNGQILFASEAVLHGFPAGNQNFFVGNSAGNFTITGSENSGFGTQSLNSLTSGTANTALGKATLINLTNGTSNTVVGAGAGSSLVSGSSNVLIGANAGSAYTSSESNNIILGDGNPGVVGETNTIRIGTGQQQQACYVDGIYGQTVTFDPALPVFADDQGKLGTFVSSIRFKDCVRDMGDDSDAIFKLRPVSYCFRSDKKQSKQYGLIAEEVNDVFPDLVVKDGEGDPFAVRYHELPVLILNEVQEMKKEIKELREQVKELKDKVKRLENRK